MSRDQPDRSVEYTIRDAGPGDADAIAEMTLRLIPDRAVGRDISAFHDYFSRPKDDIHPGTRTVVACDAGGNPVGYLMVRPDTEFFSGEARAYIERLATTAEAEGMGAGRQLMAWAAAWARSEGFRTIALDVFANNARARRFYGRNGYEEDFLQMVRTLGDED